MTDVKKMAAEKTSVKPMTKPAAKRSDARSRGREVAVQLLYSFEQNKYVDDGFLLPPEATEGLDEETVVFAKSLLAGFIKERPAIDAAIDKRLDNWTIHRLAVADRALLRLGSFELLYCADTPAKVIINEYIELAKLYGSDLKTSKLVNAVLDKLAKEQRTDSGKKA